MSSAAEEWAALLQAPEPLESAEDVQAALALMQMRGEKLEDHVVATLPDGREARLQLMLYGHVRLYWGPPGSGVYDPDSGYDYDDLRGAMQAVYDWREGGFAGEPEGWFRHLGTARRRPEGDPTREYVRP